MRNLRFISLCLGGLFVTACYQKKAERSPNWGHAQMEVEDEIIDTTDQVYYVDTFQLVSTHTIAKDLNKNLKRKWVVTPLTFEEIDESDTLSIVHQIAMSEVYSSIGNVTKNVALVKASNDKIEELTVLICEEENSIRPSSVEIDSLPHVMKQFYLEAMDIKYLVYADAHKWLENVYLTLQQSKNIKSSKQFDEVLKIQWDNGHEMLIRLYAFQEFDPLAQFSQQLITLLDGVKENKNYAELLEMVIDVRAAFGQQQ